MATFRSILMFGSLILAIGCSSAVKELEEVAKEGTSAGDCRDGADNDDDGMFDCDDPGCRASPDCGGEGDADADSDADADADADGGPIDEDSDGYPLIDDCNDTDASVNPGAIEVCDGVDNDCSGEIDDDAVDGTTYYDDQDSDGYGDPGFPRISCEPMHGHVLDDTDCDDFDSTVHPNATESCDSIDEDCDGDIDEGLETTTFYADEDDDGYGDPSDMVDACAQPDGRVENASDCDDDSATAFPGGTEISWNGIDEDCDGYDLDFMECAEDSVEETVDLISSYEWTVSDTSGTVGWYPFAGGVWEMFGQRLWLDGSDTTLTETGEVDVFNVSITMEMYMNGYMDATYVFLDAAESVSCELDSGPVSVNFNGTIEINPYADHATSDVNLTYLLLDDPSAVTYFSGCDLDLIDLILGALDMDVTVTSMVDSNMSAVAEVVGELLEETIEDGTELICHD
jgi:hypothetical protein